MKTIAGTHKRSNSKQWNSVFSGQAESVDDSEKGKEKESLGASFIRRSRTLTQKVTSGAWPFRFFFFFRSVFPMSHWSPTLDGFASLIRRKKPEEKEKEEGKAAGSTRPQGEASTKDPQMPVLTGFFFFFLPVYFFLNDSQC